MRRLLAALVLGLTCLAVSHGEVTSHRTAFEPPQVQPLNLEHETSFVVFPADTNANPPMAFGGKLFSEMDRCAAIACRRLLYASSNAKDAVTANVEVKYHKPAQVKDLLFVHAVITRVGKTSIYVHVEILKEVNGSPFRALIASADFTFVSFDVEKKIAIEHGVVIEK